MSCLVPIEVRRAIMLNRSRSGPSSARSNGPRRWSTHRVVFNSPVRRSFESVEIRFGTGRHRVVVVEQIGDLHSSKTREWFGW